MTGRVGRWRDRWRRSLTVLRAPRATIAMYGGDDERAAYRAFTARHPRFPVTSSKRWGVALLPLPGSFDGYLAGGAMAYLRRQRRRAEKSGYRYATVEPASRIDEILELNRSAPSRQGRPMDAAYLDLERVVAAFRGRPAIGGILDAQGRLRAYVDARTCGDVTVLSHILGHADDLAHGTMYLLVSEAVRESIERGERHGRPHWIMYDTFWGASAGLAFFKERCGFRPYRVRWTWSEEGSRAGR